VVISAVSKSSKTVSLISFSPSNRLPTPSASWARVFARPDLSLEKRPESLLSDILISSMVNYFSKSRRVYWNLRPAYYNAKPSYSGHKPFSQHQGQSECAENIL